MNPYFKVETAPKIENDDDDEAENYFELFASGTVSETSQNVTASSSELLHQHQPRALVDVKPSPVIPSDSSTFDSSTGDYLPSRGGHFPPAVGNGSSSSTSNATSAQYVSLNDYKLTPLSTKFVTYAILTT